MAKAKEISDLDNVINLALARANGEWAREDIEAIIKNVIETMGGDIDASHIKLFHEIEELAKCISDTKKELASIRPDEIRSKHLPQATDELDAIVGATEEATGTIMDSCEKIEEIAATLPAEQRDHLVDLVTKIYESCSFQDITGQRVTKVVKALKEVEGKVDRLLHAFGDDLGELMADENTNNVNPDGEVDEKSLLNGPQLKHNAIDQDEVDKLFSS